MCVVSGFSFQALAVWESISGQEQVEFVFSVRQGFGRCWQKVRCPDSCCMSFLIVVASCRAFMLALCLRQKTICSKQLWNPTAPDQTSTELPLTTLPTCFFAIMLHHFGCPYHAISRTSLRPPTQLPLFFGTRIAYRCLGSRVRNSCTQGLIHVLCIHSYEHSVYLG